jgi:membrane peptidoglycan carboxypeptidase
MALGQSPLTPIEQASTFATLADDGMYHTPHVIASMQLNGAAVPSAVPAPRRVLTPAQAADIDYALSFDNRYSGGTAVGAVPFRVGDMIGKTGTLGNGDFSSEAWFLGALPDQYSMAVALFTNLQSQDLDNLPGTADWSGSYGGAWPATIWNAYMTREFANTTPIPLFQTVNGPPFVAWIQVHPQKKVEPNCKFGQFKNCKCPHGDPFCAHPNPGPTCHGNSGNCTGGTTPSPSPSPSCGGFGQQPCSTPSPSPSPSVTPSFQAGATTTSAVRATSASGLLALTAREPEYVSTA